MRASSIVTSDELLRRLAGMQHGVITLEQARALGMSKDDVRTRVRRGQYARLWRGVIWLEREFYDQPPWESRAAGALLLHGSSALLGLGSAARLLAIAGADEDDAVIEVILPRGAERHQVDGIRLHTWNVPADRRHVSGCLRSTDPIHTAADLVPRLARKPAIAFLDSALHSGLMKPEDLVLAQELAAGRPGCQQARTCWDLADGRAESPLESWVRIDCVDANIPPDDLQHPVRTSSGQLLGYGDLAWQRAGGRKLIGEADGRAVHSRPEALFRDRYRANAFVAAGADVIRYTWQDARRSGRCAAMTKNALRNHPA